MWVWCLGGRYVWVCLLVLWVVFSLCVTLLISLVFDIGDYYFGFTIWLFVWVVYWLLLPVCLGLGIMLVFVGLRLIVSLGCGLL